jgi:hypothetical protein
MTEENSGSQENVRELGKFIRKFFDDTYLTEKEESAWRIKRHKEIEVNLKPWWDKGKDLLSARGLFYLKQSEGVFQELQYNYLLSLMTILAEAFETLTRNVTIEDREKLTKRLEDLSKKSEEDKQKIDEHIAKRLGELFGKDGKGYIG